MTLKEHSKHTSLARPAYGNFCRNEWALVGANCNVIKSIAGKIIETLSPKYQCAYVDASHENPETEEGLPGRLDEGATLEYTDQIRYRQFHYQKNFNAFQYRRFFNEADLVLVNGNHQQAKAQIVFIDPAKEASLQKRLPQLTQVQLFLVSESGTEIFPFLKNAIPNWENIPVLKVSDTAEIIRFFERQMQAAKPKVNGLVLAGGRSLRMGSDKNLLNWHGREQQFYLADQLQKFCDEVYISCRPEQETGIPEPYKSLPDTFTGLGPMGAILSAFRHNPNTAWMVLACDLPLVTSQTLSFLTENRNTSKFATAFVNPENGFPEPLLTIWEPKSYPVLLSFLAQGYSCPRKMLINSEVQMLKAPDPDVLNNVNTPEEREQALQLLKQRKETV